MTNKDRNIKLFLQFFFIAVGIYLLTDTLTSFYSGRYTNDIFEFYNEDIPAFHIATALIAGLMSIIGGVAMWLRMNWAAALNLCVSGMLFCLNLESVGSAIYRNPYEAVPPVIILVVLLQSFPFLMRQALRNN